jgi:hypothetical protein
MTKTEPIDLTPHLALASENVKQQMMSVIEDPQEETPMTVCRARFKAGNLPFQKGSEGKTKEIKCWFDLEENPSHRVSIDLVLNRQKVRCSEFVELFICLLIEVKANITTAKQQIRHIISQA